MEKLICDKLAKKIRIGSDFSGVGAFDQALLRMEINYETVFACDIDKFARQTFISNYGEPKYYPSDVYEREIPSESLDFYMTSPPCQSFSLAGRRLGKHDKRGVLFFNSFEFIESNKPRYFIFENVKGLLSDNGGITFSEWVNLLGGKSINGNTTLFPYDDAVPYHIYFETLNAKDFGVPQNRERVFIVGIRDDSDNFFQFPKKQTLLTRLKDVLEVNVDDKYYLSKKIQSQFVAFNKGKNIIGTTKPASRTIGQIDHVHCEEGIISCLAATDYKQPKQIMIKDKPIIETLHLNNIENVSNKNVIVEAQLKGGKWDSIHEQSGRVYSKNGISPTISTMCGGYHEPKIIEENEPYIIDLTNDFGEESPRLYSQYAPSLRSSRSGLATNNNCLIRKLTPKECFRLMDFPDSVVNNAMEAGLSNSQLYKQAGNSIVVSCLVEILKKLNIS